jgi:predicted O-methyltransferase YrrM
MGTEVLKGRTFKGFLDEDEAEQLYALARESAPLAPCLEIGSYCGHSAAYLGLGCREAGGILFSIDHHSGSEEQQPGQPYFDPDLLDPETGRIDTLPKFRRTLRELSLEDTVVPILCRSEVLAAVWSTPLSLIFIDGGHTFEAAFNDYNGWVSHLKPGGYLLIHDIFPDPAQGGQAPASIYKLALASGLFLELPTVRTLGVLKRASIKSTTHESLRRRSHPWD